MHLQLAENKYTKVKAYKRSPKVKGHKRRVPTLDEDPLKYHVYVPPQLNEGHGIYLREDMFDDLSEGDYELMMDAIDECEGALSEGLEDRKARRKRRAARKARRTKRRATRQQRKTARRTRRTTRKTERQKKRTSRRKRRELKAKSKAEARRLRASKRGEGFRNFITGAGDVAKQLITSRMQPGMMPDEDGMFPGGGQPNLFRQFMPGASQFLPGQDTTGMMTPEEARERFPERFPDREQRKINVLGMELTPLQAGLGGAAIVGGILLTVKAIKKKK